MIKCLKLTVYSGHVLVDNNNNNNQISTVPYGRNFRGAGSMSDQCSVKAWLNRKVLGLDLKTDRESLMRTVCTSEFQTDGAENWKACLEKSIVKLCHQIGHLVKSGDTTGSGAKIKFMILNFVHSLMI